MIWYTFKKLRTVEFKLLFLFSISKHWGVALVKRELIKQPDYDNSEVSNNPSLWG